jgi:hypothetical protein
MNDDLATGLEEAAATFDPVRVTPLPDRLLPIRLLVSGLYRRDPNLLVANPGVSDFTPDPSGGPGRLPVLPDLPFEPRPDIPLRPRPLPIWWRTEDLRVDVDGWYPQMTVSGMVRGGANRLEWIASVQKVATNTFEGGIWYKNGQASLLPQTTVRVRIDASGGPRSLKTIATFSGGGLRPTSRVFSFVSRNFRSVEFEYDHVAGCNPVFAIDTAAHPNRPATLPAQTLSIEDTFRRSGFAVAKSGGDSPVPISGAGANQTWSDQEMHDAMQVHWSRFANKPQWSLWVFWAALHDRGTSLGGIMYDDIGPNHRQGTAIFTEAFIKNAPAGDPAPAAWVARMRFWTAVHEMGHAFNLAHSWQKDHPPQWGTPWIPLANETEARSFMNYPYNVSGGQTAFFSDFDYRFSDQELLFMRHAPERFVQMGNADWFDNHAFENAQVSPEPSLKLEARVNRAKPVFEFLEPVMIELKLTNVSGAPLIIDQHVLEGAHDLTLILKAKGKPARQWHPYATYCLEPDATVLQPGESFYHPVFAGVGSNGWDVAEPGRYLVQACLRHGDEDVVSAPLELVIRPPLDREEEVLAQDLLTDDVGRVLAFDGSRELETAIDTLKLAADKFKRRRLAAHAQVALGLTEARPGKLLREKKGEPVIEMVKANLADAKKRLEAALATDEEGAAETLGHIEYTDYAERFADILTDDGDQRAAVKLLGGLEKTLAARKVLPRVIDAVRSRREALGSSSKKK